MRYKHKISNTILDTEIEMNGEWLPLDEEIEEKDKNEPKTAKNEENNEKDKEIDENDYIITEDGEKITRNDIIQELNALGVKFDKRYSTKRLYNLMINC